MNVPNNSIHDTSLNQARFIGDRELFEALKKDEVLSNELGSSGVEKYRKMVRKQLLSSAVRVDARMLPKLSDSFKALKERSGLLTELEAYVFEEASINAFVTSGDRHTFVALSSGAINKLPEKELEFVIGHELGHAIFGHINLEAANFRESEDMDIRSRMQVMAWKRATEISADRCGLICCGSIDVAASAMFRTLSGLSNREMNIKPEDFTEQWDHLMEEVVEGGDGDHWQMTHPFPPLRMKAMMLYWNSDTPLINRKEHDRIEGEGEAWSPLRTVDEAEKEISMLLATMDPLSRERDDMADPILADFMLWGGLFIACANGKILKSELKKIKELTSEKKVKQIIEDGGISRKICKAKFEQTLSRRHERLKSAEINRILKGMLQIAYTDGEIDDLEKDAFREMAGKLGINHDACDLVLERFLEDV